MQRAISGKQHGGFVRWFGLGVALLWIGTVGTVGAAPVAHPRAHAHNDYEHSRPLLDALDQGFCSVEADIWPVDGELLVAHDRKDLKPGRTLERLYLAPLAERARANGGRIHPGVDEFSLLVDVKADPAGTWALLAPLLERYQSLLTRFTDTNRTPGAVTVILSGARPVEQVRSAPQRWCGLDGRLPDLTTNPSPFLYPWVSDSWRPTFARFEDGKLVPTEREKLRTLVRTAHAQGRRIRFWGLQDEPAVWQELWDAGVDLINTDRLADLNRFLSARTATNAPER